MDISKVVRLRAIRAAAERQAKRKREEAHSQPLDFHKPTPDYVQEWWERQTHQHEDDHEN